MRHEEYARVAGVNWSLLKEMQRSPAHYRYRLANPRPDSPAMLMGRAVHAAVLEPDTFARRYVCYEGTRRGKAWEAFQDANGAAEILTAAEWERCLAIRDAVRTHPAVQDYLWGYDSEVTLTWTDADTGIPCKCRVDIVTKHAICDLKTTAAGIGKREFARTVAMYGYHGQMAHYLRGVMAHCLPGTECDAVLIAVESDPPHDVAVYKLDSDALWAGDELVSDLLAKLKECQEKDEWPGRYGGVQELSLPAWAFDEIEEGSR